MAIDLTDADHQLLDEYLEKVLDLYRTDKVSRVWARSDIAEAFSLLARGNESFRNHMEASLKRAD